MKNLQRPEPVNEAGVLEQTQVINKKMSGFGKFLLAVSHVVDILFLCTVVVNIIILVLSITVSDEYSLAFMGMIIPTAIAGGLLILLHTMITVFVDKNYFILLLLGSLYGANITVNVIGRSFFGRDGDIVLIPYFLLLIGLFFLNKDQIRKSFNSQNFWLIGPSTTMLKHFRPKILIASVIAGIILLLF